MERRRVVTAWIAGLLTAFLIFAIPLGLVRGFLVVGPFGFLAMILVNVYYRPKRSSETS
jgi:hypothetical protein